MTYAKAKSIDKEYLMNNFKPKFSLIERKMTVGSLFKEDLGIKEFYDVYLIRLPAGESLEIKQKNHVSTSFEYLKKIINKSVIADTNIYPARENISLFHGSDINHLRFLSVPNGLLMGADKKDYSVLEFILDFSMDFPSLKFDSQSYEYGEINGNLCSYGLSDYKSGPRIISIRE
jgi:hypothetical protein